MTRSRKKYITSIAAFSFAVFTISSIAPTEIVPDILAADHAVAKSGNGGGNGSGGGNGNGGGNGGGKGNSGGNGSGASKSASKGGNGVGQSGNRGSGKVFDTLFGNAKGKQKKSVAANPSANANAKANHNGKTKPKDLMAMGIHPSDLKGGWMGVLMANPNGNFNSSISSVHGRARDWMEANAVAGYLADQAAAAGTMTAALEAYSAYETAIDGLDEVADADAIAAAREDLAAALPDGVTVEDVETAIAEAGSIEAAMEQADADAMEAMADAAEAQAKAQDLFEAVTHGMTPYDEEKATTIADTLVAKDEGWQTLMDNAVDDYQAEAEATADEMASVE